MANANLDPAPRSNGLPCLPAGLRWALLLFLINTLAGCSERTETAAQRDPPRAQDRAAQHSPDTTHARTDSSTAQPLRRDRDPFEFLAEADSEARRVYQRYVNPITRLTGAEEDELDELQALRSTLTAEIASATDPEAKQQLDAKLEKASQRIAELQALAASRRRLIR